jgi:GNAT superfamily N-acetyltransferase
VPSIRPFDHTDADYDAVVEIWNAQFPAIPTTVQEQRYNDKVRNPERFWGRVMAEVDGRPVATSFYGVPLEVEAPGEYLLFVQVHPGWERRGIGTAVYDHVVGILEERDPAMLTSFACEEEPDDMRFLTKRGYERIMREQDSRIDVASFDASRFEGAVRRVANAGIEIRTAAELDAVRPGWRRELWELDWELAQDEPHTSPPRKLPFEEYSRYHFEAPGYLPDALFVAVLSDRIVGRSGLWKRLGAEGKLFTGMTGTARSERRRGIATALKVKGIEYARTHGFAAIETNNEENNPMYQLNLALGFEPIPAWWWLRKTLGKGGGGPSADT